MTDCTEPRCPAADQKGGSEGRKGMTKVAQP
jgi:hypothetical protein